MPAISVIIPAYNAEKYLLETIESVWNQTYQDFEVIVVDDGSTDQTLALLNQISDPRLSVVLGAHRGVSAARNRGIAESKGEFLAFLDADDLWTEDKLKDQIEALKHSPKAGLAYSWTYYWMYDINEAPETAALICPEVAGAEGYRALLEENIVSSGSNIFVRRAVVNSVGGFDETLTHGEDWEFCFRVALKWEIALIRKPQVFYRQHGTSICSSLKTAESSSFRAIDKMFEVAPLDVQRLKPKTYANLHLFLANLYLARTAHSEGLPMARANWFRAVKLWPAGILRKNSMSLGFRLAILSLLPVRFSKSLLSALRQLVNRRAAA